MFKATLRGADVETPVVDVAVTFPAKAPTVTIANARFDGTDYPETNGITAILTPRTEGNVTLLAQWGGHPFSYEVDLIEQGGTGSTVLPTWAVDRDQRLAAGGGGEPVAPGAAEHRARVRGDADDGDDRLAVGLGDHRGLPLERRLALAATGRSRGAPRGGPPACNRRLDRHRRTARLPTPR